MVLTEGCQNTLTPGFIKPFHYQLHFFLMCGCEAKNNYIFLCRRFDAARFFSSNDIDIFLLLPNATAANSMNEIIFTKLLDDAFELKG